MVAISLENVFALTTFLYLLMYLDGVKSDMAGATQNFKSGEERQFG